MGWLTGWNSRKEITIQDANVDGNLTDFPILVHLDNDSELSSARADGYDIRFTQSDGETLLKYERESWSGGGGSAVAAHIWVKVPSISASGGATIYIYFDKADATDGEDASSVWDANYKGIWHMKNATTTTVADSTTNSNTGTKLGSGEPAEASGKIDKGQDYDGDDDSISCGDDTSLRPQEMTLEGWLYSQQALEDSSYPTILGKQNYGDKKGYTLGQYSSADNSLGIRVLNGTDPGSTYQVKYSETNYNEWMHIVGVYDGTYLRIYKNGIQQDSLNIGTITIAHDATDLSIGVSGFNAILDELRISNIARSAEWIKFTYHNINEADNELTWEEKESVGTASISGGGSLAATGEMGAEGTASISGGGSLTVTGDSISYFIETGIIVERMQDWSYPERIDSIEDIRDYLQRHYIEHTEESTARIQDFPDTSTAVQLGGFSDIIRIPNSKTPASANAPGKSGVICWDENYLYVCIDTNTWKRVGISTW